MPCTLSTFLTRRSDNSPNQYTHGRSFGNPDSLMDATSLDALLVSVPT